jgi:hypothetical protein
MNVGNDGVGVWGIVMDVRNDVVGIRNTDEIGNDGVGFAKS